MFMPQSPIWIISLISIFLSVLHPPSALTAAAVVKVAYQGSTMTKDVIAQARCEVACLTEIGRTSSDCFQICLETHWNKPGSCDIQASPATRAAESFFSSSGSSLEDENGHSRHNNSRSNGCEGCQRDGDCPGISRCCMEASAETTDQCYNNCQEPKDLLDWPGLPPRPFGIFAEERKNRHIYLRWFLPSSSRGIDDKVDWASHLLMAVIEVRYCVGKHFNVYHASPWRLLEKTIAPMEADSSNVNPGMDQRNESALKSLVHRKLRPGHWYQFRVALVGGEGTRGFSEPSPPFSLEAAPSPPGPPIDLKQGATYLVNGSLHVFITWSPAHSDLPVTRYKVFWSRRLGVNGSIPRDTIAHQQNVPKGKSSFLLPELERDAIYYIQVVAFSNYGLERLRGEPADLILDTSSHIRPEAVLLSRVAALHSGTPYFKKGQLRVPITWKRQIWQDESAGVMGPVLQRYVVRWRKHYCMGQAHSSDEEEEDGSEDGRQEWHLAGTTYNTEFELSNLEWQCSYQVDVRPVTAIGRVGEAAWTTVTIPPCNRVLVKGKERPKCHTSLEPPLQADYQVITLGPAAMESVPGNGVSHDIREYRLFWLPLLLWSLFSLC